MAASLTLAGETLGRPFASDVGMPRFCVVREYTAGVVALKLSGAAALAESLSWAEGDDISATAIADQLAIRTEQALNTAWSEYPIACPAVLRLGMYDADVNVALMIPRCWARTGHRPRNRHRSPWSVG